MRKDLKREIDIPEDIVIDVAEGVVSVKKDSKELKREFPLNRIQLSVKDSKFVIFAPNATRRQSKMLGTIQKHVENMIEGLENGFEYELEICNVHFPMNVSLEDKELTIKSFLGEKKERKAKVIEGVDVDIKGNLITVRSSDIERAGQTAANIEKASRVNGRDRRIFQDGIFITKKCGREI